jgi:hypothetical protein
VAQTFNHNVRIVPLGKQRFGMEAKQRPRVRSRPSSRRHRRANPEPVCVKRCLTPWRESFGVGSPVRSHRIDEGLPTGATQKVDVTMNNTQLGGHRRAQEEVSKPYCA